jgi:four helix bundle protein
VRAFTRAEGASLAEEIRRTLARSGGSLVAAASAREEDDDARRALSRAHRGLLEVRYFLYLARRLGCLDLKRYKELSALQDAALRELASLLS